METLSIETRDTVAGTWLYFRDLPKQEHTIFYQRGRFELESIRHMYAQEKRRISITIFTTFKFADSTTAEM